MTLLGTLAIWLYAALSLIAVIALASALYSEPTKEDPAGGAGSYAPIVALCTAGMVISQLSSSAAPRLRPIQSLCIGLGSIATAYLWYAAEAEVHPSDVALLTNISILFLLAIVATATVPLIGIVVRLRDSLNKSVDCSMIR